MTIVEAMNIRNLSSTTATTALDNREPIDRSIKSSNTTDREGNGQQQHGSEQAPKEPMNAEQLEVAVKNLENLPAVKELGLSIEVTRQGLRAVILLKELSGKVIRRIPEDELWTLPEVKSFENTHQKGQLLRKSA